MIRLRRGLSALATAAILPLSIGCHHQAEPEVVRTAHASGAARRGRTDATGRPALTVATVVPTRRDLVRTFEQPGHVEASAVTDLYPKVAGYVKTVHCDIGDTVKADQVLLEVDVPELTQELAYKEAALEQTRAEATQAEAGVKEAEANLAAHVTHVALATADTRRFAADRAFRDQEAARYNDLAARSATTSQLAQEKAAQSRAAAAALEGAEAKLKAVDQEKLVLASKLDAAQAEVRASAARIKVAEADRDRTRIMFDYARMRAPYDGVIISRSVDEGAYVRSPSSDRATPIMTLARMDRVRVVLQVPEREILAIRVGSRATVALDALGERRAEGKVARTSRALGAQKTMRVEIDVANPEGLLYPGMYGHTTVYLEEVANALTVPAGAIDSVDGRACVVTVSRGVAHRIPVTTGLDDGKVVQILDGLSGTERIIVSNKGEIAEGQAISDSTASEGLSSAPGGHVEDKRGPSRDG